jgi:3-oxoacyl-[acyl-carrier protein] reductase
MFNLDGRVALVTGASQGIGRATAIALARAGARVAAAARNAEKLAAVTGEIEADGGEALGVTMDVASAEQVKSGFRQAIEKFGKLDILVNNAAITRDGLAVRMKADDWEAVLRTNLTGAHLCAQQAMSVMMRARYGRIINVTSVVAETGNPGQVNYVAAKAGLIGLTRALAAEIASRNITVNDALLARIPLGRMGTDSEVASAILFLASEEAGYITGTVLDVNGGLRMG